MPEINADKKLIDDYHLFTNDSEFLEQLGLKTFTTGTLYQFWNTSHGDDGNAGRGYAFRKLFLSPSGERDLTDDRHPKPRHWNDQPDPWPMFYVREDLDILGLILPLDPQPVAGPEAATTLEEHSQMLSWRFEDNNKGSYILVENTDDWEWTDPREEIEWGGFSWSDLAIEEFDGKRVEPSMDAANNPPLLVDNETQQVGEDWAVGSGLTILLSIPAMNDWVRYYEIYEPDLTSWSDKDLARKEFIDDIKTSKSGCLSIPVCLIADVTPGKADQFVDVPNPDYIPPNDPNNPRPPDYDPDTPEQNVLHSGVGSCPIREDFTLQLFLKDSIDDPDKGQVFALPAMTKVGVAQDATGRPYGSKSDGDLTTPEESDVGTHIAADIDLHYNEYTSKYQSGSRTILAKVTIEIPNANGAEDVELLEAADNVETLNELDDNYLQMGTGEAMPISMQNGNPFQWTPNYASPADCRGEEKGKQRVIVYNADPQKSFKVGKTVLLHEVDGKWFPIEFGSGESTEFVPVPIFKGRWEIQQFLTSAANFFCLNKDGTSVPNGLVDRWPFPNVVQFSPDQHEKWLHRKYYLNDLLNNGSDLDPIKYAGKGANAGQVQAVRVPWETASYYRQVTGFDYLEDAIGGNRGDRRSIDRIVFEEDGARNQLPDTASPDNTLYFGCVFPDGYTSVNVDTDDESGPQMFAADTRSFDVVPYQQGRSLINRDLAISAANQVYPKTKIEDADRSPYVDSQKWPDDDSDAPGRNIGIFGEWVRDNISDFVHIPADYATQCSPSGTFGRPITNMDVFLSADGAPAGYDVQKTLRLAFGMASKTEKVVFPTDPIYPPYDETFGMYQWMYKRPVDGWPLVDPLDDKNNPVSGYRADFTNSAMDWKPFRANHIQFRPCNMELYSNHQNALETQVVAGDRGYIFNYVSNKLDGQTALSFASIERTRSLTDFNRFVYGSPTIGTRSNFLYQGAGGRPQYTPGNQYGGNKANGNLIHDCDFFGGYNALWHNTDRVSKHNVYGNTQATSFRRVPLHSTDGGQMAVGVIGAVCTVGAAASIGFTTQNKIGMISWFLSSNWYPAWGGSSFNKYDKFGTTDLSVRIYQAHPREDMLYDSRFFSVHHFNPGTSLSDGTALFDAYVAAAGKAETRKARDTDGDGIPDTLCMESQTNVDIPVPTYVDFEEDCLIAADPVARPPSSRTILETVETGDVNAFDNTTEPVDGKGDTLYKDAVHLKDDAKNGDPYKGVYRLLPSANWDVLRHRRGKLLPYVYRKPVAQSPFFTFFNILGGLSARTGKVWAASEKMENYSDLNGAIGSKMPALETIDPADPTKTIDNQQPITEVDFVLKNLGRDYKIGDRFTITGFPDSEVTVASIGTGGCITGLRFDIDVDKILTEHTKLGSSVDTKYLMPLQPEFVDTDGCADFNVRTRKDGDPGIARITKSSSGAAKLKPFNRFSTNGKGFQAFVTKAVMRTFMAYDPKPKIATYEEYYQLSLPADNRKGGRAGGDISLFGFVIGEIENKFIDMTQGERVTVADITPQGESPSGLYDCFFHFHNDISHTVLNNDNLFSAHNSYDQYIDLTINPA